MINVRMINIEEQIMESLKRLDGLSPCAECGEKPTWELNVVVDKMRLWIGVEADRGKEGGCSVECEIEKKLGQNYKDLSNHIVAMGIDKWEEKFGNSKLLDCPFCGGSDVAVYQEDVVEKECGIEEGEGLTIQGGAEAYYVHCDVCGVEVGVRSTKARMVSRWNRRAEGGIKKAK